MKFRDFKNKYANYPIIDSQAINLSDNPQYLRRQISEWQNKNFLIELKRGHYVINEAEFKNKTSLSFIANQLYKPSYISLEYALSSFGIIPEAVRVITSITTKKTAYFENDLGRFSYTKIRNDLFFGFEIVKQQNQSVFFANKEKALLDFIYSKLHTFNESIDDFENYRFSNLCDLDLNKLQLYANKFKIKKLNRVLKLLLEYINEEKDYKVL